MGLFDSGQGEFVGFPGKWVCEGLGQIEIKSDLEVLELKHGAVKTIGKLNQTSANEAEFHNPENSNGKGPRYFRGGGNMIVIRSGQTEFCRKPRFLER